VVDVERARAGEQLEGDDGEGVAVARGRRRQAAACSGEMYAAVPRTWPVCVTDASLATVAIPKSPTARRPCWSSSRLRGLTSRCTTSWPCAQSSAIAGLAQPAQRERAGGGGGRAEAVGDGAAGEVLHDHEGAVVVLADVVDGHDVAAVAELRGGPRLAQEPACGRARRRRTRATAA
jgi:hypothetical protein